MMLDMNTTLTTLNYLCNMATYISQILSIYSSVQSKGLSFFEAQDILFCLF